jgi:pimeloyl-ACP methyl ester carboxylesterase
MATVVLVHGACHGGWCWEPIVPLLERQGHAVAAPDLPCDDPAAGVPEYVDAVISSIAPASTDVVLVGHSLAGLTIPAVAARRRVSALVFLAAIVGMPGRSLADLAEIDADRDGALESDEIESLPNGTFIFTEQGALRALYHDCADDVARAAAKKLRPQRSLWREPSPISAWPSVRMESIVCAQDRVVNRPWAERIARERLHVEPILLDTGHSPMLSSPEALADVINGIMEES